MTALLIIAWLVTGYASFVYWWTKDFDFCVKEAVFAIIPAPPGPLAFLLGFAIHGKGFASKKPLIKKRGAEQ